MTETSCEMLSGERPFSMGTCTSCLSSPIFCSSSADETRFRKLMRPSEYSSAAREVHRTVAARGVSYSRASSPNESP